jgi:hypothetical protein
MVVAVNAIAANLSRSTTVLTRSSRVVVAARR